MKNKLLKNQSFWISHIKAQLSSGLSQAEYCRRENLKSGTFSSRKAMLKGHSDLCKSSPLIHVPLTPAVPKGSISIKLANGIELKFDTLPDPLWLSEVVRKMDFDDALH
jgi:hypothetical protein